MCWSVTPCLTPWNRGLIEPGAALVPSKPQPSCVSAPHPQWQKGYRYVHVWGPSQVSAAVIKP